MQDLLRRLVRNRLAWMVCLLLLAAGAWYFGFARVGNGSVSYETQAVDRGNIETAVASSGTVTPLITVTVGSEVSGKLTDVAVDFNARVRKGQLLAQIDPSTFKSRLESANADLVVQMATVGAREVDVQNADVTQVQAQRDLERARTLFATGLVSSSDLEKARNAADQAGNNLKIARANLNNARSQIVKVQATLDQAKLDLARTEIRSPVDGVIINRQVDPGQTVQASMQAPTLFQVAQDLSQIKIETKVDEADIGSIREGGRATFTVDAFPDRTFSGTVAQRRINGTSVQNVVTYSVMVQADNPGLILLPGMTANVKIITAERRDALRLPASALRFRPAAAAGPTLPDAAAARGSAAGGPGGQRGSGGSQRGPRPMVQLTPEVMQDLGLGEEQQARVTAALKDLAQRTTQGTADGAASNPLGGGGPNFRGFGGGPNEAQLLRQRLMNALGSILTPEQMQKYQAMAGNNQVRPATVWVLDGSGQPVQKSVRIGLSTDSQTELIAGLNEGDKVIVRARTGQK